jgi:hypothetical protein
MTSTATPKAQTTETPAVGRYVDSDGGVHPIREATWEAVLAAMDEGRAPGA